MLALAEQQHGAVATRQAVGLGLDRHRRSRLVRSGRWEPATSRVLRLVGSPRTPEQRLMIAVLQAGPQAIASHASAAWLWDLPGFAPGTTVTRPRSHGDRATGGHRPTVVPPHHVTVLREIPVTSLPRTIFDLAAGHDLGRMARLVDTVVGRSPAMLPALHRTFDGSRAVAGPGSR